MTLNKIYINNKYNKTRGQSQYSNNKPVKDNPFANANGPIELNDDDLPF